MGIKLSIMKIFINVDGYREIAKRTKQKLIEYANEFEIDVVDYVGNRGKISCNSCCVLFPVAFSVNGNAEYQLFLKYIAKLQG